MNKAIAFLLGVMSCAAVSARAATISLTSGGDLAAAIADETCDRVELGDGTYEVSAQISVSRALTIVGVNGRDKVTVRPAASVKCRIFNLNHAQAIVQGLTITGGSGASGSGVNIGANGGQVLGLWYWYGEHKTAGKAGNVANVGVHVYSSPNLLEWTDRGIALPVEPDEASDIAWRLAPRDVKCQIFKFHEHDVLDFRDVKCYNRFVHVPKGVLHVRWKKRIP